MKNKNPRSIKKIMYPRSYKKNKKIKKNVGWFFFFFFFHLPKDQSLFNNRII